MKLIFLKRLRAVFRGLLLSDNQPYSLNVEGSAFVSNRRFVLKSKMILDSRGTKIEIGEGTCVGAGINIQLSGGTIKIGRYCAIQEFVEIKPSGIIEIEDGSCIGKNVCLQSDGPSLYIASKSVVGAGSLIWAHTGPIRIGPACSIGRNTTWVGTGSGIEIASSCYFDHNVTVDSSGGNVQILQKTAVGPGTILYGHGGLVIGEGCAIAGLTMIIPGNHVFSDPYTPLREQGVRPMPVRIGDNVWIGAGVAVLGDSVIGRRAVVGAGAVVAGAKVAEGDIVVGVPARRIRQE